jgi:hypothetical protein
MNVTEKELHSVADSPQQQPPKGDADAGSVRSGPSSYSKRRDGGVPAFS